MAEAPHRGCLFPGFEITSDDTVVDVGCGSGADCLVAGRLGAAVVALDVMPGAIQQVAEAMRGLPARSFQAIQSDCRPIPLPDAVADVVVCKEVLEHVEDPAQLLGELARIGKPDARYLISVPDPISESLLAAVAPSWYFQPPFHQHVFARDDLDALVRAAGLVVEQRDSCGAFDAIWWAVRFAADVEFDPRTNPHAPEPPILSDWERLWGAIVSTPGGPRLAERLNALLPKSQVLIARKAPVPSAAAAYRPHWLRLARRLAGARPGRSTGLQIPERIGP